jgi:hypothetical protein
LKMERLFRLRIELECLPEQAGPRLALPEGTLVMEPRATGTDAVATDWVFLASTDNGRSWREYATVLAEEEPFPAVPLSAPRPSSKKGGSTC